MDNFAFHDLSASAFVLAIVAFISIATLVIWQFSSKPFDLADMFTSKARDTGEVHVDGHKIMLFGSWVISSYVLVVLAQAAKLGWEFFTAYLAAFVSVRLGSIFLRQRDQQQGAGK